MEPWLTIAVVALLAALAFGVVAALRLEKPWLQPWALVRATAQLAVLTLVLRAVLDNGWWVAAFIAVMLAAASWVVCQRLALPPSDLPMVALMLGSAGTVPLAVVFATGALPLSPRYLLALSGITIGGTMAVATVMGRTLQRNLREHRHEIEGWLALGAPMRTATARSVREAGSVALMPATDQTRTTGLVALPGAFVGSIFAGASPAQAAQFQLLVLASILAAGALTVVFMAWRFGDPRTLPPC